MLRYAFHRSAPAFAAACLFAALVAPGHVRAQAMPGWSYHKEFKLNTTSSGAGITTSGGAVNAGTGTMTCGALTASGTCTLDHIVMNGNINMSGNNCNTANGYVMSGAPHRANLGTVTFNAAGLQSVADRCDFIQNTEGTGTGWAS